MVPVYWRYTGITATPATMTSAIPANRPKLTRQSRNIESCESATPERISGRSSDRGNLRDLLVRRELRAIVLGERTAATQQLPEAAAFRDRAVTQHENAITPSDGGQPMRDDEGRAALHQPLDRLHDQRLGLDVERRGRLVKDQDRRVAQQGTGNRDPLFLPLGQGDAAFAEQRLVSVGHTRDRVVDSRQTGRALDRLAAGAGTAVGDV